MSEHRHHRAVVDQFTRQAIPFSRSPAHSDDTALAQILRVAAPRPDDRTLDVACGTGIITRLLAPHVAHITGIDLTAAMLARAEEQRLAENAPAIEWRRGEAESLPFPDASFDLVITRYSFHHIEKPDTVLREMARVCRPGGRVVIVDVVMPEDKVAAFDAMERLRDDSHTATLTPSILQTLVADAGLVAEEYATHDVSMTLEFQLGKSFPVPGGAEKIRALFRDEPEHDRVGLRAERRGEDIHLHYPTGVLRCRKPTDN